VSLSDRLCVAFFIFLKSWEIFKEQFCLALALQALWQNLDGAMARVDMER